MEVTGTTLTVLLLEVEIDRLGRSDDDTTAVELSPDPVFGLQEPHPFDGLADVARGSSGRGRTAIGRSTPMPCAQQLAEPVDLFHVALDGDCRAPRRRPGCRRSRRRRPARPPRQGLVAREGLPADDRHGDLRIEGHEMEAWPRVLDDVADGRHRHPKPRACRSTATGRRRSPPVASPPRQYTADMERRTGCPGSTSAMVRSTATVVKGSADGILKRWMPLVRAASAIDIIAPLGELPASMWTSRGGKARTRLTLPRGRCAPTHPSSTSGPTEHPVDLVLDRVLPGQKLAGPAEGVLDDPAGQGAHLAGSSPATPGGTRSSRAPGAGPPRSGSR